MKLRTQLLVVSLLLLSLPWAGCQYLREMESTLRQGQGMATQATARAIAAALREQTSLLYPASARATDNDDPEWYLPTAAGELIANGYDDDWREQPAPYGLTVDNTSDKTPVKTGDSGMVSVQAATRGGQLFLLLRIQDSTLLYSRPDVYGTVTQSGSTVSEANGDRVELHCTDARGALNRYFVTSEAPGAVRVRSASGRRTAFSDSIHGALRERAAGYAVELMLPLDPRCQRLDLRVIDASDTGERVSYNSRRVFGGSSPWLVYRAPRLDRWLQAFSAPGRSIRVSDRRDWVVGLQTGKPLAIEQADEVFWLLRLAYRAALKRDADSPGAARFLQSHADIVRDGERLGGVSVTETTERYLALTDRASSRVFGVGLVVLLLAFAGLLGYASILSFRIRRLSAAAQNVSAQQLGVEDFPRSTARDELGELSRSYGELLRQIDEYNSYLKGLARTLSHELRTPIAVVRSSLDHLENASATEQDSAVYRERAASGLARLTRIVTAMSEASRIEESVQGTPLEPLDVTALISELRPAYAASFEEHVFPDQTDAPRLTVLGNGELLAQALDKIVDNAASFAAPASAIVISVGKSGEHDSPPTLGAAGNNEHGADNQATARIAVSNPGPLLPDALRERLFEPMVTQRTGGDDGSTHLGLGLHIARAIASAHGGRLEAANLADGSGVVFTLVLPIAPAQGQP